MKGEAVSTFHLFPPDVNGEEVQRTLRLDALKASALESCEWRGHDMSPWRLSDFWRKPFCECRTCGASVHVTDTPAPNGIDIAGPAVALDCPTDARWL